MKMIGKYTTRGRLTETESEEGPARINLFDGSFKTAYRVIEFYIWPSSVSSTQTSDLVGKLATSDGLNDQAALFFNAEDGREIAWAGTGSDALDTWGQNSNMVVDPDNLIVEDLYVYVRGAIDAAPVNYMIVMEKYEISDWQGALTMARDKAMGDD